MAEADLSGPATDPRRASRARSFGIVRAAALVRSTGRPITLLLLLAAALLSGFLEAGLIVVVVTIAAGLASDSGGIDLDVGPVDMSITTGTGILVGFALTALLLATATVSAWTEARLAARLISRLRAQLFRGLMSATWAQQSSVIGARFQELIMVHTYRMGNLVLILLAFIANVLGLVALIVAALLIDARTAGVLVGFIAVLALLFRPLVNSIRRRSELHVEVNHDYIEELADTFGVLQEVRVLGVRNEAADRLDAISDRAVHVYEHMMFRGRILPRLYFAATAGLLLAGLGMAGTQGSIELERIGAIVLFLLRALRYSQQAQSGWQAAVEQVPNLEQVEAALEQWRPVPGEFGSRTLKRAGVLELREVGYIYPTGQIGIMGLDLTIQPGEIVGLAGPSGSGKSTIGQLVLGLRRPTHGEYLVDGTPVTEFDEVSWYSRFAYVAQGCRLIDGDIRDNVRFLRSDLSDAAIDRAIHEAGIATDVALFAAGDAHQVGSGGREVSGGQRQRIAIARALAGDPDVLVMDEPTSALDAESEEIVRSTLLALKGRVTVILIAHRESTLTVCDRVLTVNRHQVEERQATR